MAVKLLAIAIAACLLVAGCASDSRRACGQPAMPRDNTPRQVTVLGDDISALRNAFNEDSSRWRAIALVSPTCSECVLGAEAVEQEITARYSSDQVATLVIWIPMLPTDSETAARSAASIFRPGQAQQFYDANQVCGTRYAQQTFAGFYERARTALANDHWLATALDDRIQAKRPQWDLYMLYAPGIRWEQSSDAPPMPTHWIRHLGRGEDRTISTYWQDIPESGPRQGNLMAAVRSMAVSAIGKPRATRIEVLGFEGCPNLPQLRSSVEAAVRQLGLATPVAYVDLMKLPEDDRRRGWPSPTVLVNGHDLFGMPQPQGSEMGCRAYSGGLPNEREIQDALAPLVRQ